MERAASLITVAPVSTSILAGCATASGVTDTSASLDKARQEGVAAERARQQVRAEKMKQQRLQKRLQMLEKAQERLDNEQKLTRARSAQTVPAAAPVAVSMSQHATASSYAYSQKSCAPGLAAGGYASCPFARSVRTARLQAGRGSRAAWAYSSVTGRTYKMHCYAGRTTECHGGNKAIVFIR